jgi:hypothetical protein
VVLTFGIFRRQGHLQLHTVERPRFPDYYRLGTSIEVLVPKTGSLSSIEVGQSTRNARRVIHYATFVSTTPVRKSLLGATFGRNVSLGSVIRTATTFIDPQEVLLAALYIP